VGNANCTNNQSDTGNECTGATVNSYPLNASILACQEAINASVTVQRCSTLYAAFSAAIANATDDCAVDYSLSGGPATATGAAFLAGSLRGLEQLCLQLTVQNNDTSQVALQEVRALYHTLSRRTTPLAAQSMWHVLVSTYLLLVS
jgi:hypothetical protein